MIHLIVYIILIVTIIILAWNYFRLLDLVEKQSEEMDELRYQLFKAETKIDLHEFSMELNKKTLEAFHKSQNKEEVE